MTAVEVNSEDERSGATDNPGSPNEPRGTPLVTLVLPGIGLGACLVAYAMSRSIGQGSGYLAAPKASGKPALPCLRPTRKPGTKPASGTTVTTSTKRLRSSGVRLDYRDRIKPLHPIHLR